MRAASSGETSSAHRTHMLPSGPPSAALLELILEEDHVFVSAWKHLMNSIPVFPLQCPKCAQMGNRFLVPGPGGRMTEVNIKGGINPTSNFRLEICNNRRRFFILIDEDLCVLPGGGLVFIPAPMLELCHRYWCSSSPSPPPPIISSSDTP